MRDSNGVCKRSKTGKRVHSDKVFTDGFGRKYVGCIECGAVFVVTGRPTIIIEEGRSIQRGVNKK